MMDIHWHEGLFLLPHHLQRLQRNFRVAIGKERGFAMAYPYGTIECRLSQDDLENKRLRFDKLQAVMPSGLVVNFPDDADLPSIDFKEELEESSGVLNVFLAVPLWFGARANCLAPGATDGQAKILHRVVESEWADENTGSNRKPILERRVNARLLFEGGDRADLETIPLLRIIRGSAETGGVPRQDPEFAGPCLVLGGSPALRGLVRDLNGQIQASRQELLVQMNRGGFSVDSLRGTQYEQLLRLQALNRCGGRLESLLEVPSVTPFEIYLEIRDLLGALCALYPDRDLYETTPYLHDDPYFSFRDLAQKIRMILRGNVAPRFMQTPFVERDGLREAVLADEHITGPSDYFLGIRTKEDPLALARFVENEDRFKLMPRSLAARAIRGVLLKEERLPPLELPAQEGLYYFRLLRGECAEVWKQILTERTAIVRWSGHDAADYQVSLYMTLPHAP